MKAGRILKKKKLFLKNWYQLIFHLINALAFYAKNAMTNFAFLDSAAITAKFAGGKTRFAAIYFASIVYGIELRKSSIG